MNIPKEKGSKAEDEGSEKRKPFPWKAAHAVTGNRLHLTYRADRARLLILCEDGRQVCSCRVDVCGVPFCIIHRRWELQQAFVAGVWHSGAFDDM
jgi:hypothetical protein